MNKSTFMEQLESLLQGVSPAERQEALQYYNDYFDDAGIENENEVIERLGSPQEIAQNIIHDINEEIPSGTWQNQYQNLRAVTEYENGATGQSQRSSQNQSDGQSQWNNQNQYSGQSQWNNQNQYSGQSQWNNQNQYSGQNQWNNQNQYVQQEAATTGKSGMSGGTKALLIVLAVLSFPIWGSLLAAVIGTLVGLIAAWFGIVVAACACVLAFFVSTIVLIIVGCMAFGVAPMAGVALLGIGLIMAAFTILFIMLSAFLCCTATPAICRGIGSLFKMIFKRR